MQILRHFQVKAGIDASTGTGHYEGHAVVDLQDRRINLRIASIPAARGEKLSIRIQDPLRVPFDLGSLGLTEADENRLRGWIRKADGMVLVSGPTGSGKTSTLYALLRQLASRDQNIMSLEDPVEILLEGVTQIEVDAEQSLDFPEGLVRILRHDPDVIAVGEVRDQKTARLAVHAALSGHVLLSSLHARDSAGTISLLRNFGIRDHQIASTLRVLISQRIFRLLCEHCRRRGPPERLAREWLEEKGVEAPSETFVAVGCERCAGSGYHGLTAAFELWHLGREDYELILDHADEEEIRDHRRRAAASSLLSDALAKAEAGRTSLSELERRL